MYKLLLFLFSSTYLFANINVMVSILPQKTFLHAIGGDKINITLMVQPGHSPHTYEPKPSQMSAVTKADLYFSIGVEFEHVWLPKFISYNKKMQIIDLTQGIKKIHMQKETHSCEHEKNLKHQHKGEDPHVWTSPKNVKIMAQNIYDTLVKFDVKNKEYYKNNLDSFLQTITQTDKKIKKILSTLEGNRTFMVFHPSWGYFAKEYTLKQLSVEVEGKSPKPKEIVALIHKAKENKVNAIFTQAEFSESAAKIIANDLHIPVVKVTPMAANWSDNLIYIANTIAGKK